MVSPNNTSTNKHPVYVGLVVFSLLMLVSQFLSYQKYILEKNNQDRLVKDALYNAKDQLETSLNYSYSALKTLGFIHENYGVPKNFDSIALPLLASNKYIDALELVDGNGVITHVYPIEGNKVAIGFNILKDEIRSKEAYKTIEKKDIFFAGPFELYQGGVAVVGRLPLYKEDKFVGFSAVIIKISTLIEAIGIYKSNNNFFEYQLSKINPITGKEDFFLPNSELFKKELATDIDVPNGEWKLYVKSKNTGWYISTVYLIIFGFLFSLTGATFAWYISKQPEALSKLVTERTSQILKVENRYRALVENSSDAFVILNANGNPIFASASVQKVLGYSEEEVLQKNLFEIVYPDDVNGVSERFNQCLANPGIPIQGYTSRLKHKDGSWRWLEATITNLLHDPDINGIVDNFRDVTEKIILEEKSKKDYFILKQAETVSRTGSWELDISTNKLTWSDGLYNMLGYVLNEFEVNFENAINIFHPDERVAAVNIMNHAINTGEFHDIKKRLLTKHGAIIYVNSSGSIIKDESGKPSKLLGVFHDITEQVNNENQIRWLINNTEESFVLVDNDLKIVSFNNQYANLYKKYFGIPVEIGTSIIDYALPERREVVIEIYRKVLKGNIEESQITMPLQNGNYKTFHIKFRPALDDFSQIIGVFVSVIDITEKLEAEKKITETIDELKNILDSSLDLICTLNLEGYFVKVSAAAEKILGYKPNELEGESFLKVIFPDDIEKTAVVSAEIVAGKPTFNFENRYVKKDGTIVPLIWSVKYNEKDNLIYGIAKDATSIIEAEKQIRESEAFMNEAQKIAKMGSWNFDFRTDKLTWSDTLYDVFDVDRNTFKETHGSFISLVDIEDQERVKQTSQESQITGKPFNVQYNITTQKGERRVIEEFGYVEKDEFGKVLRLYGTAQDITERKKAELEIQQFKKIVESSKDGIAIADVTGKSFYVNPSFEATLGYTTESFNRIGGPSQVYLDKNAAKEVFDTLLSGNYWQGDIDLINIKGEILHYYLSGGPIFDNNKLVGIYGIHTDIGERIKNEIALKAAFEEKNNILESIGDGFFTVNNRWEVTYWNNKAEKLLDVRREDIIGKNLWTIFSDATTLPSYTNYNKAMNEKAIIHFEDYYLPVNRWFEISAYPAEGSISVYFKDITERKKAEDLLNKINISLKNKTIELTRSNAELEQFAYVASHDLQEPLRMVTSFLNKIEEKYEPLLDEKGKKYIHLAVDGAIRMRKIILDLLEYSRSGRVQIDTEPFSVADVVKDVLRLFDKKISETHATITTDELPRITASVTAINQIFRNLIGNALKYSKADVKPVIHIGFKETETHWQFYVKDNGIGISSEFFDKLFILFQRLHERNEYSGTGIGLAVCKKLVERHQGEIWLASKENAGSTFYFTIKKKIE